MKIVLLACFVIFCFQIFGEIPFDAYIRCKKSSGLNTTPDTASEQIKIQVMREYHLCLDKEKKVVKNDNKYQSKVEIFCDKKYIVDSPLYNDCIACLTKKIKPAKNFIDDPKGASCLLELQGYSGLKTYDKNFLSSQWYKNFIKTQGPTKGEPVTRKISTENTDNVHPFVKKLKEKK